MSAHQNICVQEAKRNGGGTVAGVEQGGWGRKWGLKNWLEKGGGGGERGGKGGGLELEAGVD